MLDSSCDCLKGGGCGLLRGLGAMWSRSRRRYKQKEKKSGGREEPLQVNSAWTITMSRLKRHRESDYVAPFFESTERFHVS